MNPSNLFEHLRQPFPLEKSNLHSDNCQVLQVNSSTTSLSSSEFPKNDSSQDFWGVEIRFSQRKSANKAKSQEMRQHKFMDGKKYNRPAPYFARSAGEALFFCHLGSLKIDFQNIFPISMNYSKNTQ